MKKTLLLCSLFFLGICFSLAASTLHVIAAYDTTTNIKRSTHNDKEKMERALSTIAQEIDHKLELHELVGKAISKNEILARIEKAKIKDSDILLFYYTGHGFRDPQKVDKWPMMNIAHRRERLALSQVVKAIKKKKPRLAIILCDSCNNTEHKNSLFALQNQKANIAFAQTRGLKKLFLRTDGLILCSASQAGKRAWSTFQGGIFTQAFLLALQKEALKSTPNWQKIFKTTKKLCKSVKQKPQVELHITQKN